MRACRLLGATTTYHRSDGTLSLREAAWKSVEELDASGLALDWMVLSANPYDPAHESQQNLAYKLELARKNALHLDYDYLFLHEHDIILPKDALKKLLKLKADLATGVYRLRRHHGAGSDLCLLTALKEPWVAFDRKTKFDIGYDERLLSPYKIRVYQGQTFQVPGSGLGCLLISRHVLRKVPFRWIPSSGTLDVLYACEVAKQRFKYICNGSVQCGHEDEERIIYRINDRYWESTLMLHGGVWKEFSKIVPLKPLKSAKLHLGPNSQRSGRDGWINCDLGQEEGIQSDKGMDQLRPRLPFEDDFFTEIELSEFAERILDKAMLLNELWRVSKDQAIIQLRVLNDNSDPKTLSYWGVGIFDFLSHRFRVVSRSSKGRDMRWVLRSLKGR